MDATMTTQHARAGPFRPHNTPSTYQIHTTSWTPAPHRRICGIKLANVAAAIQPAVAAGATRSDVTLSCDDGGKNYDIFQVAVLQGFSHSPGLQGIQQIWAL